ncbi:MAG TPA: hypothetical protein VGK24_22030 [Candidatus Angelobacter sp.]
MKKTIVRIILLALLGLAGVTPVLADGGGGPVPLCYPSPCRIK